MIYLMNERMKSENEADDRILRWTIAEFLFGLTYQIRNANTAQCSLAFFYVTARCKMTLWSFIRFRLGSQINCGGLQKIHLKCSNVIMYRIRPFFNLSSHSHSFSFSLYLLSNYSKAKEQPRFYLFLPRHHHHLNGHHCQQHKHQHLNCHHQNHFHRHK